MRIINKSGAQDGDPGHCRNPFSPAKNPTITMWLQAVALFAFIVFFSVPCLADSHHKVVMIAFESQREMCEQFAGAMEAQLAGLPVTLIVKWIDDLPVDTNAQLKNAASVSQNDSVLTVVWYDRSETGGGYMYLTDSRQSRVLLRRIEPADEGGSFEALTIIVGSAVEVMLRGGKIGIVDPALNQPPPVTPPPVKPPPVKLSPPSQSSPRQLLLGIGVAYMVQMRSEQNPFIHAFVPELVIHPKKGFILTAGYSVFNRVDTEGLNTRIEVIKHPFHLGANINFDLGRVHLGGKIVITLDYVQQKTLRLLSDNPDAKGFDNSDFLIALTPAFTVDVRLTHRLFLTGSIGAQVTINNVEYIFEAKDRLEIVETPKNIQPNASAGIRLWLGPAR